MKSALRTTLTGGSVLIPKRVLIVPERRATTTSDEQFTSGNCLRSSEVSLRASKPPTGFDGESSRTRSSLPLAFFWGAGFRLKASGFRAGICATAHGFPPGLSWNSS